MIKIGITGSKGILGSSFVKKYKKKFIFYKYKGDICKKKDIIKWLEKREIDVFLHLAAASSREKCQKNKKNAYRTNVIGTKNIIETLNKRYKKIYIFFSSTSNVYSPSSKVIDENFRKRPNNFYGNTKLKAENLLMNFNSKNKINVCIGRIFNYTHSKQKKDFLIPSILKKLKNKKKTITINNLGLYRDFLHIDDICTAINRLIKKKSTGIYNICSQKRINLKRMILIIKNKIIPTKKVLFLKENNYSYVGSNKKLRRLGWTPKKNISHIINEIY